MTSRTRNFVMTSLVVLLGGVGVGLVAYYAGYPMAALPRQSWPDELRLVPRDATLVAYADVQGVMASDVRQRIHRVLQLRTDGPRAFEDRTGISIEQDIDHVVACATPAAVDGQAPESGLVLARGRFDRTKIEALMRQRGARVASYKGKPLIVADASVGARPPNAPGGVAPTARPPFALAFIEPGLAAFGSASLVREAIDRNGGGASVTGNQEIMGLVQSLRDGNLWAVGRFDALAARGTLPAVLGGPLPSITWFSVSGSFDDSIRGVLTAETRDAQAATSLRDMARGYLGLLRLGSTSTLQPGMQTLLDSLELGGTGTTVALSFEAPATLIDTFGGTATPPTGAAR